MKRTIKSADSVILDGKYYVVKSVSLAESGDAMLTLSGGDEELVAVASEVDLADPAEETKRMKGGGLGDDVADANITFNEVVKKLKELINASTTGVIRYLVNEAKDILDGGYGAFPDEFQTKYANPIYADISDLRYAKTSTELRSAVTEINRQIGKIQQSFRQGRWPDDIADKAVGDYNPAEVGEKVARAQAAYEEHLESLSERTEAFAARGQFDKTSIEDFIDLAGGTLPERWMAPRLHTLLYQVQKGGSPERVKDLLRKVVGEIANQQRIFEATGKIPGLNFDDFGRRKSASKAGDDNGILREVLNGLRRTRRHVSTLPPDRLLDQLESYLTTLSDLTMNNRNLYQAWDAVRAAVALLVWRKDGDETPISSQVASTVNIKLSEAASLIDQEIGTSKSVKE